MNNIILLVFLSAICLQGCKKENRINRNMEGTWKVTEYSTKNNLVTAFPTETRTFEFSSYKKAYTRTMKGIFKITYTDLNKLPVIDTFDYQLKGQLIEITKVQNKRVNGVLPNTQVYLKRRFLVSNSASSVFTLTRVDSTDIYIRATKQ